MTNKIKVLPHYSDNPKWLDSRVYQPDGHCSEIFECIVRNEVNAVANQMFWWYPKNDYKDGYWKEGIIGNGYKNAEVLYWRQRSNKNIINTL